MRTTLWRAIKRQWDRPVVARADLATLVMGYIATVTAGTGFVYLLPTEVFALSPSFATLRQWGGEGFWSIVIWSLGLLGLAATWLEWQATALERERATTIRPDRMPSRRFGRVVWFLIACLWCFFGAALAWVTPYSPGAVAYGCLGILSLIVSSTARQRLEAGSHREGGGGR